MGDGLKVLSGKEVIDILTTFGFFVHGQKGSHVKLHRLSGIGKETLMIPNRNPVPNGTLRAIFRQASRDVPQEELRKHFYKK